MRLILTISILVINIDHLVAQTSFAESCIGKWLGTMYIYKFGQLKDSVPVVLTVTPMDVPQTWRWKMEYLSPTLPVVKDYQLRLVDNEKNIYVTDEGGGVELKDYQHKNKLFSIFETEGYMLTATYELMGQQMNYEVTSGKREHVSSGGIINYTVDVLQSVMLTKQ